MTDAIRATLEAYRTDDEIERADVARLLAALERADVYSRAAPMHVTGSALVVHPPTGRVLMRWHPRMGMWMQVGGHFDAGETDARLVALREAREETGLTDLRAPDGPGAEAPVQVVIVPVPAHGEEGAHEHADIRYLFVTDAPDALVEESDAAKLRWLPVADARSEATETNLREFLTRVEFEMVRRYPS